MKMKEIINDALIVKEQRDFLLNVMLRISASDPKNKYASQLIINEAKECIEFIKDMR